MKKVILSLMIMLFMTASMVQAADVPAKINYQGRLTQPDGSPITDGNYTVHFRIYDAPTGGTQWWTGSYMVATKEGYFSAVLGSGATDLSDVPFDLPLYLGITIGSDGEMTPRQQLNSVPYSMRADNASPQVHSGEKEITEYQSGYFYVNFTRIPRKIELSLHLKPLNKIHYQEMPRHTHSVSGSGVTGDNNQNHSHNLRVNSGYGNYSPGYSVAIDGVGDNSRGGWIDNNSSNHNHNFSFSNTSGTTGGNNGSSVITGSYTAKTVLSELKIKINGLEKTSQIASRAQSAGQITGNIDGTDSLFVEVTDFLEWHVGENEICFYHDSAIAGGDVIYDLYVWY